MKYTQEVDTDLKKQLKNIPSLSGVYMMFDKKGSVIYIGKALNLKNRIRSYFNVTSWKDRPKLSFLVPKIIEIKTVVTRSEKEALILEANLVNKYQPKYNVTLKDDKKFPWLMITYDEKYPRVVPIRDVIGFKRKFPKTKNKFFGPYSDSSAMWETYKILKEGFQLRLRRKPLFKDRPCMNYHLGLCSGPCQSLIIDENYYKIVRQVEDFLLGKYDVVLKDLKSQMKEASKNLEYEKAARLRDTIKKIEKVLEKQVIVSDDYKLNQDIFGCYWDEKFMVLELLLVREGKVIAVESFTIELPKGTEPADAFNDGVKQYYTRIDDDNLPNEIVVQFDLKEKKYVEEWLSGRLNKNATVIYPKKGKKLELVKMAERNAKLSLQRVLLSNHSMEETLHATSLVELKQELNLKNYPHRIECFDISHLGGTGTVASMVTFIDGKPEKSEYRKFKIKSLPIGKIDDFASMREIVSRRYRRDGVTPSLPDLIIIDGGKGQLNAAKEALENLQIDFTKIDLISLAKKREEVFKVDKRSKGEVTSPLLLDRKSQALFALQRIRDEAHRFAITFQRDTRAKDTFESKLEKIPGLTKAKIKKLMNYFGSIKNIQESDLKIFTTVFNHSPCISKAIWEKIRQI
ncbi:MAG: excinuclease ABC subunit C [Candidatus Melainabacteria bacterium RIFCSPHIGHO2_02_FULL_34_12]|nr:MAG: excinuclease ABC subunit C [Candidatus Melainabacteria bacterium RIFCSPHIGHO2_02_FULL_34_12]